MARIVCAISGIRFDCTYLESIHINQTQGYFHPIFALPNTHLYKLYTKYSYGQLSPTDSYLLFLAFLHNSSKIEWESPAALNPVEHTTKALIANNIAQLISILEQTAIIRHPSFSQPSFKVTLQNSNLYQIPNWIKAWQDNIDNFHKGIRDANYLHNYHQIEEKLSKLILSGESPENYPHVIANWAAIAGEFPSHKEEFWKNIIRSCFNSSKMFSTPLAEIKEVKEHCECNIESGSIHSFTLYKVLNEGIKRHVDYLGGSPLSLGYTLLPSHMSEDTTKNDNAVLELISEAPPTKPNIIDYPSRFEYLKAKLAYSAKINSIIPEENNEG